jgi:hypothetical protein
MNNMQHGAEGVWCEPHRHYVGNHAALSAAADGRDEGLAVTAGACLVVVIYCRP